MSCYQKSFTASSRDEAERQAKQAIKEMDFMRQPSLESVAWVEPINEENGYWIATIRYWGLD